MFQKHYEDYLDACVNDIVTSSNPRIKKDVLNLKKLDPDEYKMVLRQYVHVFTMSGCYDVATGEQIENLFEQAFHRMVRARMNERKLYVMKVTMRDLEDHIERVIQVPGSATIAEMVYAVLYAMNSWAYFEYTVRHKRSLFLCDDHDDYLKMEGPLWAASQIRVGNLGLVKRSRLEIEYDIEEGYVFDVLVTDVTKVDHEMSLEDMKVLSGKGYGIWENERDFLYDFYEDPRALRRELKHLKITLDGDRLRDFFDVDECNAHLREGIEKARLRYEDGDYVDDDERYHDQADKPDMLN